MKFTVVWQPRAERELAVLWQRAPDRNAVTQASDRIDRVLESIPDVAGEDRPEVGRVLFDYPLGVVYRLSFDDRLVQVLSVWDISLRP